MAMPSATQDERQLETRAPARVRRLLLAVLGLLLVGALYLIAVRGEALVVDLATLAGRMWCF